MLIHSMHQVAAVLLSAPATLLRFYSVPDEGLKGTLDRRRLLLVVIVCR